MPVFSQYFEKITLQNEDSKQNVTEAADYKGKKKLYLSHIEKQNKETLKEINDKRNKHKNLSKAQREKQDSQNCSKHWVWIAKKEIPRGYRLLTKQKQENEYNSKKLLNLFQKEVKKKTVRLVKQQKDFATRGKKLHKEMLAFWRRRDREMNDTVKKKEKIETEKKKMEEEMMEAEKQTKRLEFLMKKSDYYSFYMQKKLGVEDEKQIDMSRDVEKKEIVKTSSTGKQLVFTVEIDNRKAEQNVNSIIDKNKNRLKEFDQHAVPEIERLDNPEIDFSSSNLVEAPRIFRGQLKEYQLNGLRWLDSLYEQGINGILADEMGLGKTIQAIALLAHIVEKKGVYGPFLVIAPKSTLFNWKEEIEKFCPALKVLPYWGSSSERKILRKFITDKNLHRPDSPFHVVVTSYLLAVSDEKVFHRIKWHYVVLDEAQAIKNNQSQRWKMLLSFESRNKLLLTGTPIQNTMSELWALLHFIMPDLFDSHEHFQEWFSKDIEAHSKNQGELNQEQLRRLHSILKPFMLRRVKKDVENQIAPKKEVEMKCLMTEKQTKLYNGIKNKLNSISNLFSSVDSKENIENLMNLVMQLRKVCNHPEMFERNIGRHPFVFKHFIDKRQNTYQIPDRTPYLVGNMESPIKYRYPKLFFDELEPRNLKVHSIFSYYKISEESGIFNIFRLFELSVSQLERMFKTNSFVLALSLTHYINRVHNKHLIAEINDKTYRCINSSFNYQPQNTSLFTKSPAQDIFLSSICQTNLISLKSSFAVSSTCNVTS